MTITNNGNQPKNPFNRTEYWMVSGEWEQIFSEPSIATADNPNAQGRQFVKRMTASEVINCHPMLHAMQVTASQNPRPRNNYIILYALPITKEQFEFIMGLQPNAAPAEVIKIADLMDKKGG